ncbi:D-arabinono-1,4-lactone oxidase [Georgenia alba]|uniref:D-arabinono-1,4-lactone oxidase n=1 Tax=Georgenia alba TaxID=2233858 RepID=A0ABW2Q668_9MICO
MSTVALSNWSGSRTIAGALVEPTSLADAAEAVARSRHVRATGSRHSFNDVTDSAETLISLRHLAYRHPRLTATSGEDVPPPAVEPELDEATGRVRVSSSTRYADLALYLHDRGRSLPNFASLPHISVAGSLATATHGSGVGNPILAAQLSAVELIDADGGTRLLEDEELDGARVSLGALGLVTSMALETVSAFEVAQTVYGPVPFDAVVEGFEEISRLGYSVSCFTTLREDVFESVWVKRAGTELDAPWPSEVAGTPAMDEPFHPIPGVDPANATAQLGEAGPSWDRLPHFRADHMPSAGEEIQCEYLVPRQHAAEALRALRGLAEPLAGLVQVAEVRSVAADTAWLSPMHRQDCVAFHFTLVRDTARVAAVLPAVDAAFAPYDGRPHWGKVTAADPARVRALYPRREDFLELAARLDPDGKFRNDFVRRWVG